MVSRRNRFKLNKTQDLEAYWLLTDQDFARPIAMMEGGYYFVSTEEKATVFLTEDEAKQAQNTLKPPSLNNPLKLVKKYR